MAETWIKFTDDDVFVANAPERRTIAAVKRRDDLAEIVGQVIGQVRQAYQFSNRELGPEMTIPEGLKARATAIALWRFVTEGVPRNPVLQTKERESAFKEAQDFLEKIANAMIGKVSAPSVGTRHRRFTACDEEGL